MRAKLVGLFTSMALGMALLVGATPADADEPVDVTFLCDLPGGVSGVGAGQVPDEIETDLEVQLIDTPDPVAQGDEVSYEVVLPLPDFSGGLSLPEDFAPYGSIEINDIELDLPIPPGLSDAEVSFDPSPSWVTVEEAPAGNLHVTVESQVAGSSPNGRAPILLDLDAAEPAPMVATSPGTYEEAVLPEMTISGTATGPVASQISFTPPAIVANIDYYLKKSFIVTLIEIDWNDVDLPCDPTNPAQVIGSTTIAEPVPALSGSVTEEGSGDPLADVWVAAVDGSGQFHGTTTDAAGDYAFEDLAADDYLVEFVPPTGEHAGEWFGDVPLTQLSGAVRVEVPEAGGATADAQLGPGGPTATLAGTVTEDGGGPIEGAWVAAVPTDTFGMEGGAVTGPDGTYQIEGLRPVPHLLAFIDPDGGHTFEYHDDSATPGGATLVTLEAGATTTVDAGLAATTASTEAPDADGTLAGTVSSAGGGGVPGAWVGVVGSAGFIGTTADANGDWSISVPPGDYRLEFLDPSGDHVPEWHLDTPISQVGASTAVTVLDSETTDVDATLASNAATGSITGSVAGDSTPLPGAWVAAVRASTGTFGGAAVADANGDYAITGLRPTDYLVIAIDPDAVFDLEWFEDQGSIAGAEPVTVGADAPTTVDFDLPVS